ncbi:uncharacterized protein LOC117338363 [Pecten maximus]|uniref:uncharacterized protein LOC117338363 n=1 Tax=Pecten maximus TaxID=6579 RepID=UPI0014581DE1|nr:uncharacterized protein LOC117338363 [Pecten maximus]XP_033755582.1 uncharacterized protein LOC117338363 [Pecten maximus]XP_033755583.1 uncharacterized protein LOC117338363 [Pecten maximus]
MAVPKKKAMSNNNSDNTKLKEEPGNLRNSNQEITEVKEFQIKETVSMANLGNTTTVNMNEYTKLSVEKSGGDFEDKTSGQITGIDQPGNGAYKSEDITAKAFTGRAERSVLNFSFGNTKKANDQALGTEFVGHDDSQHSSGNKEEVNNDQGLPEFVDHGDSQHSSGNIEEVNNDQGLPEFLDQDDSQHSSGNKEEVNNDQGLPEFVDQDDSQQSSGNIEEVNNDQGLPEFVDQDDSQQSSGNIEDNNDQGLPEFLDQDDSQQSSGNIEEDNNDQTDVPNADCRRRTEDLSLVSLKDRCSDSLVSLMIPKRPYLVTKVFFKRFSLLCPNGPYLSTQLFCEHMYLFCTNGPFFFAQVVCMEVSLICPNGTYFLAKVVCMEYSLYCPNGPYFLAKVVCMQVDIAPRVTWMKPVFHVRVVKDLDVIRSDCFSKFDQQKCIHGIMGDLSFNPRNHIGVPVYAAVVVDYIHDDGTPHGTDELVISDHEGHPLIYNPGQQNVPVVEVQEVQEGPIQQPQQNDVPVLAVFHREPIAHLYQQPPNGPRDMARFLADLLVQPANLVVAALVLLIAIFTLTYI